jgi:hypothetical protein
VGTFEVLARHGLLSADLYDRIRFETIYATYQDDLGDLEHFCQAIAARF